MDILRNTTDLPQKIEITEMNLQEMKGRDKSVLAKITKFPHQTGFHQNVSQVLFYKSRAFFAYKLLMNFD